MSEAAKAPTVGLDDFDTVSAANEGAVMEVRSPKTGEVLRWPDGRAWTITYFGDDSEKIEALAMKQQDRRTAQIMRTNSAISASVIHKDGVELLVAKTKEWDIPLSSGDPAPNTQTEYRSAYTRYKWLAEQGREFTGNRGNFLKG